MKSICHGAVRFRQLKKTWLRCYSQGVVEPVGLADVRRRISSLRKRPFLLSLRRWGRFARRKRKTRNVPSGEEGGETDAGYRISQGGETESLIGREK